MSIVYAIRSRYSKKYYVGQAQDLKDRKRRHRQLLCSGKHPNIHLQRVFNLRGWVDLVWLVLESGVSVKCLTEREQFWIDKLDSVCNGMNIAKFAERPPMQGRRHSAESIAKMRQNNTGMLGKSHSESTKLLMQAAANKRWRNKTYRKKCSDSMRVPKPRAKGKKNLCVTEALSKSYEIISPEGKRFLVKGLKRFCLENGLGYAGMQACARGARGLGRARFYGRGLKRNQKGWQCRLLEET